ncbi:hypothetical protein [Glycomyces niveus]|uniref:DUF2567 domain-containing protein n=1 Tax=Glycomyces niveus TaxID=2820287 RepID=A0ABS3UAI7_9ACTN|nr:hypothetical protein [Glycomyces sp. NEAU-S30]MBO3734702.1 hypothetical protein [Glycomyces sp. NEAU-S30]
MRKPDRPPEVGQAVTVLWMVAIAFAAAFALKVAGLGTFMRTGRDAQYRAARIENTDPDLLESVPFLLEIAAVLAALGFGIAAVLFICAAKSVGEGRRRSFRLALFAAVWAALGCAGQPVLWLRMRTAGRESTVVILDRMLETLPWWVPAADTLAAIAFLAALIPLALLRTENALWFRGADPRD